METSIAFFIIGTLVSIVGWLAQRILNQILSEIKDLRHEVDKLSDGHIKARTMISSLPCRNHKEECLFPIKGGQYAKL